MIKHYLKTRENACWGVGYSTHLPMLHGEGPGRAHNVVILQVEEGDEYARRALSVDHALQVASFLAGAVLHVQVRGDAHYDRASVHYNVRTDGEGGILLSLSDTIVKEGKFVRFAISVLDALQIIEALTRTANAQLVRVAFGDPDKLAEIEAA